MKPFFIYIFFAITLHSINENSQLTNLIDSIESNSNQVSLTKGQDFSWSNVFHLEASDENVLTIIEDVKGLDRTRSFLQF
tara:strand:+ start:57214 stop:57453 length:240 start_codon:yes stop_codon:yes gene_type:complete